MLPYLVAAAVLLAPAVGAAAPWRVEVATRGGLSGLGAGAVKIRSSGDVEVVTAHAAPEHPGVLAGVALGW